MHNEKLKNYILEKLHMEHFGVGAQSNQPFVVRLWQVTIQLSSSSTAYLTGKVTQEHTEILLLTFPFWMIYGDEVIDAVIFDYDPMVDLVKTLDFYSEQQYVQYDGSIYRMELSTLTATTKYTLYGSWGYPVFEQKLMALCEEIARQLNSGYIDMYIDKWRQV